MGVYLKNLSCINPKHEDSNPSMAVYQEPGGKLMVHCFGCGFSATVTQQDIDAAEEATPEPVVKNSNLVVARGIPDTVRPELVEFFTKRHIAGYVDQVIHITETDAEEPDHLRYGFEYPLYDYTGAHLLGRQRRYLDDKHPKIRLLTPPDGVYPKYCWVADHVENNPTGNVGFTESMVDMWFIKEYINPTYPVMVLLGTEVPADLVSILEPLGLHGDYHTFFDRDKAGEKAHLTIHRKLRHYSKGTVVDHMEEQPRPKKVYQMFEEE